MTTLRLCIGWLASSLAVLLAGCSGDEAATPLPSTVVVEAAAQVETGASTAFRATLVPTPGDGADLQWRWDFGDGRSSELATPHHSYALPGRYTVTLTLRNRDDQQVQGTHELRAGAFARLQGRDCTQGAQTGWCWLAPTVAVRAVTDVHFSDSRHGVAVGELGHVATTQDGGDSWQVQEPPIAETLALVRMADTQQVWAVTSLSSRLLRSRDGGRNWNVVSNTPLATVRELWVTAAGTVAITGLGAGLARATWVSSDGGANWRRSACEASALSASGTLWGARGRWVSHDLGLTCRELWPETQGQVLGANLADDTAVRIITVALSGTGGTLQYQLRSSSDGGRSFGVGPVTWPDLPEGSFVADLRLGPNGSGVARILPTQPAAADPGRPTYMLVTSDGGRTWRQSRDYREQFVLDPRQPPNEHADDSSIWYRVSRVNPQQQLRGAAVLVVAGNDTPVVLQVPGEPDSPVALRRLSDGRLLAGYGSLTADRWYSSGDAGRSWVALPGSAGAEADLASGGVWFFDSREGLWLRADGVVMASMDGGRSWQQRAVLGTGSADAAHSLSFTANGDTGWAVALAALYRSSDRGRQWQQIASAPTNVRQVQFADERTGWVAASQCIAQGQVVFCDDRLYRTQDGGQTWQPLPATPGDYKPMAFADALRGAWVDWDGSIRYTRDGGSTWFAASTDRPLNERAGALLFDRQGRGWLLPSRDSRRVLRSLDGGASWHSVVLPAVVGLFDFTGYASVAFGDSQKGWLVGGRGVVLATQDGGSTWRQQTLGTTRATYGVFATDASTAWIAASFPAALLSTSTGGN
jgi:photosystem II stability/assembly factor-like uncharacterized protein